MPRLLKELTIHEVSSVDRGAGEGVKILLMKRAGAETDPVAKAHRAFERAVASIMADASVVDKTAAIDETRKELTDHLAELAKNKPEPDDMTVKTATELQKALDESTARETKLKNDLAFASMSDVHKGYATECKLEGDHLAAFVGKTAEQRDAFIKEFPPKKKPAEDCDDDETKKRAALPESVRKQLEQADEDRKVLKALQEKDEIATFAKRATEVGLAEADGEIMRKAYKGDAEAQKKLDEKFKALTAQVAKGGLFIEKGAGGGQGQGATAYDQLMVKARELVAKGGDKPLTESQAFTKVYTDPANAELVKQHKEDEAKARQRAA